MLRRWLLARCAWTWAGLFLGLLMQFFPWYAAANHVNAQTRIKDVAGVERSSLRGHLEVLHSSVDLTVEELISKHSQLDLPRRALGGI